jgi:hypothetical protein
MGFLDHSTNNIIIDAVLTDEGRRRLASNRGLGIKSFSFSDDEIDYTFIEKYGRAVGKEKIVKNTPVFEAQTRGNLASKYRMLTIDDPTVVYLPKMNLSATGLSGNSITINRTNSIVVNFDIKTTSQTQAIPSNLYDTSFVISLNSRFLQISNSISPTIEPGTRTAFYSVPNILENDSFSNVSARGSITLRAAPGLDDTLYSIYANTSDPNTITTIVSIIGASSGIRTELIVNVSRAI